MKFSVSAAALACLFFLPACNSNFMDVDVKPVEPPMYNMSRGSDLLFCVGQMVSATPGPAVDVFVSDIPDHTTTTIETGFLTKNAVMMVTTALDRLSTPRVQIVGRNGASRSRRQIQVLGAWTELNRTTTSRALSGRATFPGGVNLNLGGDKSYNHIVLDMAMTEGNRIIPQTATSVSIKINGKTGNTTLTYDDGGDFAAVTALGFTSQEGFHAAERLLVETSVAIMIARYYGLSIQPCLQTGEDAKSRHNLDRPVLPAYANRDDSLISSAPVSDNSDGTSPASSAPAQKYGRDQKRPSLIVDNGPVNLQSDVKHLPLADDEGTIVLPRGKKSPRILIEQPAEYTKRDKGNFSGSYSSDPPENSLMTP
jgi:hypothetical protein